MHIDTIPFEPDSTYIAEGRMSLDGMMPGASVTSRNLRISTDGAGEVATFQDGDSPSDLADMWDILKVRNHGTGETWDLRLHTAAVNDSMALAREALSERADVRLRVKQESTALHWAAALGRLALARLLVDHGADVNAVDELGWTPARLAAKQGFDSVAEFLEERSRSVGTAGDTE